MWQRFKTFPFLSAVILLALNIRMVTSGLTGVGIAAFGITLFWFGFEFIRWLILPPAPGEDPENPSVSDSAPEETITSLVYFLAEPRTADEQMIRESVSSALGHEFSTDDSEPENFVIQFRNPESSRLEEDAIVRFLVRIPEGNFAILLSDSPYIENPEEFAEQSIRDKRLRNAIEAHRAWLSVDWMDDPPPPEQSKKVYGIIGKILCAFAGPDCLAIYSPELHRCNEFDLSLLETLGSGQPLELFEEPTFEPIIEISDSNPKMAAAVAKAKKRWPEFTDRFSRASKEDREKFIVKAEFREGTACEYMWVAVTRIEPDTVEGILMNDPHELLDVHRGAEVRFGMDRLNDWIYSDDDGLHVGGFTLDVLAEGDED